MTARLPCSKMKTKRIRVNFAKFWNGFSPEEFLSELRTLGVNYDFEIVAAPDFLFFSVFAGDLPPGRYVRIFYTGENRRPQLAEWDWALGFDYEDDIRSPRYLRLPNYQLILDPEELVRPTAGRPPAGREFCNFLYSNEVRYRNRFCDRLSAYRPVACPGRCCHNLHVPQLAPRNSARWRYGVPDFMRDYKFTICFENSSYPGYTTEKLVHAMLADSIPIYWGNPLVHRDFDTRSFINLHDLALPEEAGQPEPSGRLVEQAIDLIRSLDGDAGLYADYRHRPWYPGNRIPEALRPERVQIFFDRVFNS